MKPALALALALLYIPVLYAQQTIYDGNNNLPPFGSFHGSDFDIVSLQNGNLHISIPILEVPQRGKPIKYTFLYDTLSFTLTYTPPPPHKQNGMLIVAVILGTPGGVSAAA